MPEGPEVWILSRSINKYYIDDYKNNGKFKTNSYGKHLIINDIKEDWSFGLTGKVKITDTDSLIKMNTGWIYGEEKSYTDYDEVVKQLGIDWMQASKEELQQEVNKWIKSKKKLAALILDQTKISGIGVAWGSEILFNAGLRPDMRACDQVLKKLVDIMIKIREEIQEIYDKELEASNDNLKEFINDWFSNLYEIREMSIYKKGSQLEVLGRNWWV
jgi:formamidopyrimidine-DNA glycosylase